MVLQILTRQAVNMLYFSEQKPKWAYVDSMFLEAFDAKTITDGLIKLFEKIGN